MIFITDSIEAGPGSSAQSVETIRVNGRGGDDTVSAEGLAGELADLDLDGGEGNDLLIGGDGADVLRGGAGNDTLFGNRGNDIVLGQDGNDLLIVNNGDGSDFLEGGDAIDTVRIYGSDEVGDDVEIQAHNGRVLATRSNLEPYTVEIESAETLDMNLLAGNDSAVASDGLAGLIALSLNGGEGNDLLIGGDGIDVLDGGPGRRDTCSSQGNQDRLINCEKTF